MSGVLMTQMRIVQVHLLNAISCNSHVVVKSEEQVQVRLMSAKTEETTCPSVAGRFTLTEE
jgi:hypothetical protein